MKLIVEATSTNLEIYENHQVDAVIYGLKDFSVHMGCYVQIQQLETLMKKKKDLEIFISINKVLFDEDMPALKLLLKQLDRLGVKGIFYYDLAMLTLTKDLDLKTDLIWNQTHMVTNYQTCQYYQNHGVKGAFLSSEITLDEMLTIKKQTSMILIAMVYGYPVAAFSHRKLLKNYYEFLKKEEKQELVILEPVSQQKYLVREENKGTTFYRNEKLNGSKAYLSMFCIDYIYFRQYHILDDEFFAVIDHFASIKDKKLSQEQKDEWLKKANELTHSDYTGFFDQKTIYKVKKS